MAKKRRRDLLPALINFMWVAVMFLSPFLLIAAIIAAIYYSQP